MLETALLAFAGLLPLAAANRRLNRDAGVATAGERRALRVAGALILAAALLAAGTPVPGERVIRFLGAVSLAGVVLILLLSVAPRPLFQPIRALLRRR